MDGPTALEHSPETVRLIDVLDKRLRWLAAWTIHHANNVRESRDGLKVGGHQASCASMSTIMAALYAVAVRPNDRIAVKPHASPLLHAMHYLLGEQSRDALINFRGLGGAQSYPSRTKDTIPVDFSTGSVGLGAAITAFASLAQDYLIAHGRLDEKDAGRMISLVGDAELDEGNIYECLIECFKHKVRNCWWIVDYNRQSLDATTADRMFERFGDMFATCGWRVLNLKYGELQQAAFRRPGGDELREWIDNCSNVEYAALTFQGGAAWRSQLRSDLHQHPATLQIIDELDDEALSDLMCNLGGHCPTTLIRAFAAADDEQPTVFIAYTVKGFGLPLAGHKDNHAGLMTEQQVASLRSSLGITGGSEWELYAGLDKDSQSSLRDFLAAKSGRGRARQTAAVAVPTLSVPTGTEQSTQMAFGKILLELAKSGSPISDLIVTTSPDVTVSTNLGPWVNQRGLFGRRPSSDHFREQKIPSAQKWLAHGAGQHIELGIAENNLFLLLAALGLTEPVFGQRLLPIGTVYDPFIARGLDALNYACYQDARFLLVATPSGLTLGREGGAHQSIYTPLIGMGQPGLTSFEPAFVDELAVMMEWAFNHMQAADGGSVYLRLSTRTLHQAGRNSDAWKADCLRGGYWLKPPKGTQAIVFMGAVAPEAVDAWTRVSGGRGDVGLLVITSPDLLHREWSSVLDRRARGHGGEAHIERLLRPLGSSGRLVGVTDGSPAALTWLGGVLGQRVHIRGVDRFGQCGDLTELFSLYSLDARSIESAASIMFAN